jgi:hypothetical protein
MTLNRALIAAALLLVLLSLASIAKTFASSETFLSQLSAIGAATSKAVA